MTLYNRLCVAQARPDGITCNYVIACEVPGDDGPIRVLSADPSWMACAKAGDILPVIEAYDDAVYWLKVQFPGDPPIAGHVRGSKVKDARLACERMGGKVLAEIIIEHDWHDGPRAKPMSEFDALDYLIQKDLPRSIVDNPGNRDRFKIAHKDQLPQDRKARNAWSLAL